MAKRDEMESKETTLSPKLLEQILFSLSSGALALDAEGKIVLVNPAAQSHLGAEDSDLIVGTSLAHLHLLAPFKELVEEIDRTGDTVSRRELVITVKEEERVLGVTASRLFSDGVPSGTVFLFSDLTRIRALERHAELNEQLAQIGELTAGVVHELRNPLSVISGLAELLQRKLKDDPRLGNNAAIIVEEVGNLDRLIRDFLVFSKPYEIEKSICEPEAVVSRVMRQVERLARDNGVQIEMQVAPSLPRIAADSPKLIQALSNLLRNAIEVSPPGGRVSFEVVKEGNFICFRVSDEGPGVPAGLGDSIFQPFFSNKAGGTGLGLSIVHRIITGHGGTIGYVNRAGGGACFEVCLKA